MIEPTKNDIGRKVYFKQEWMETKDWEYGIITSFNDSYVFVRYGSQQTSKSTYRVNLYWNQTRVN